MPNQIPLLGYCDKLSGRPGDVIGFKASAHLNEDYEARLTRIISADPNPDGPGMIEEAVAADFSGTYPSRPQPFFPGSYVRIERQLPLSEHALTLESVIWPTLEPTPESEALSRLVHEVSAELGLKAEAISRGGASDANNAAAVGTPAICGLGPVAHGIHTDGEVSSVQAIENSALVAAIWLTARGASPRSA